MKFNQITTVLRIIYQVDDLIDFESLYFDL